MQIKIAFQNVTAERAKKQLLLMSQSGQSEPVRRQRQTRQKKYAQSVHASVKFMIATADAIRIQYGGSMNAKNACQTFWQNRTSMAD